MSARGKRHAGVGGQVRVVVGYVGHEPAVAMVQGFDGIQAILRLGGGSGTVQRLRMGVFDVLVDEDGLSLKLPFNRKVGWSAIVGNFVISKLGSDALISLSTDEANRIIEALARDATSGALVEGLTYPYSAVRIEVGDVVLLGGRFAMVSKVGTVNGLVHAMAYFRDGAVLHEVILGAPFRLLSKNRPGRGDHVRMEQYLNEVMKPERA